MTADDLSSLSAADIDALPFGFIALGHDGTVRRYNRYEADLSRRDPREVLGRNFFREVAPCTAVKDFEGRFLELVAGTGSDTATFDFEFKFGHGHQQVRIGMTRSPLVPEVIVTINRLRDLGLPKSAVLTPDVVHGLVRDDAGRPLVLADADFWNALEDGLSGSTPDERATLLHAIGASWGRRHAERLDALIQRSHSRTLREAELQVALEAVSGSLGLLGLGRCEVDLGLRQRGLVVVLHRHDPIATALAPRGTFEAALLAGFFAGLVGHLAGRTLAGWALHTAGNTTDGNVFAIGVASRIAALRGPSPSVGDRQVLEQLEQRARVTA